MIVLSVPHGWSGVEYHRLIVPFKNIPNTQMTPSLEGVKSFVYEQQGITQVWFNRNIAHKTYNPEPVFREAKRAGVKLVIDIDDYWNVPFGHVLKEHWSAANVERLYADQIIASDYVVVTHKKLADTIMKELKVSARKIFIAPNAIDPNVEQYNQEFEYNHTNLFWQGSITHQHDLKMVAAAINGIQHDFKLTIAGYDERSKDKWDEIIRMFNVPVNLINATTADKYMNGYDGAGICFIPLENNKFNSHKSNLKLLEAGWAKKPVIVAGIHPYLPLAKNNYNCMLAYVDWSWREGLQYLLDNPSFAENMRHQLHDDVKENYLLPKVNEVRLQLIEHIDKKG